MRNKLIHDLDPVSLAASRSLSFLHYFAVFSFASGVPIDCCWCNTHRACFEWFSDQCLGMFIQDSDSYYFRVIYVP